MWFIRWKTRWFYVVLNKINKYIRDWTLVNFKKREKGVQELPYVVKFLNSFESVELVLGKVKWKVRRENALRAFPPFLSPG